MDIQNGKSALLFFPKTQIDKPVITHVIREMNVDVNILSAQITPEEDGRMFAIFSGRLEKVEQALSWLKEKGVKVTIPESNLLWDEEHCTHCGACVAQCPSTALTVDPQTHLTIFDAKQCIACKRCLPACGFKALEHLSESLFKGRGVQ